MGILTHHGASTYGKADTLHSVQALSLLQVQLPTSVLETKPQSEL